MPVRLTGLALVACLLSACAAEVDPVPTLAIYKYPQEHFQSVVDNCNKRAAGRYKLVYRKLPREADGQREQLVRRLAAEDADIDIMGLDVTWVAEMAEARWIREVPPGVREEVERGTLAIPLETARWKGKLYGAPDNTNVQLLWYRSDLVAEPPTTWTELLAAGAELKRQGKPHYVEAQGKSYEGLTVLVNTLVNSANGSLVSADGQRSTVDSGAVAALRQLKEIASAPATNPAFASSAEDDGRRAMQAGRSAFMVNWPFVYQSMRSENPGLFPHLAWAPYPRISADTPAKVTAGGIDYAVSSFSRYPAESFDAVLCLRNKENQRIGAIEGGVPPTLESVYDDPGFAEAVPMKDAILDTLRTSSVRPKVPSYQTVSSTISSLLADPASLDPAAVAAELRTAVQDALDSKGVIP
ncbi:ABC transporter substrate-binding protein [Allokutzneria albata]|uniref:Carbohydrate ABC transporter substrate-binding protein, CUT1 family n=1 Tax=Allokutzneria albata TaxID=211114 RepID=A0A1G9RAK4_ALLAB|nr:ABC transporter substrate-binding protein [Allokutzneria albata]SDM20171.1 carbohydrate ABC transporter substrate-binding protein, CUT1 family [Allokutzneria albata]